MDQANRKEIEMADEIKCLEEEKKRQAVEDIINKYKDKPGPLIPILNEAQEIYGYLPFEVQLQVAQGLKYSLAEVYGVATFYTGLSTKPKGKYRISVCTGTVCYVKGSAQILDQFKKELGIDVDDCTDDGMFSLNAWRCLGSCVLAPAVMVNDDVYGNVTVEDVKNIIKHYEEL